MSSIANGESGSSVRATLNEALATFVDYKSGHWYMTATGAIASGTAIPANSIRIYPVIIRQNVTISALGMREQTAGTNCQLAIYASGSDLWPTGTALGSTGNIDVSGAVAVKSGNLSGGNLSLSAGLYWFAINSDNAALVAQVISGAANNFGVLIGSPTQANIASGAAVGGLTWTFAQTYGTWPDLTGQTFVENTSTTWALVQFKVA